MSTASSVEDFAAFQRKNYFSALDGLCALRQTPPATFPVAGMLPTPAVAPAKITLE